MPEPENDPIADLVAEFLDQSQKELTPNPQEFLARCPESHREDLRKAISFLGKVGAGSGPVIGPPPSRLGDYQILGELGRGGMGVVYEAQQVSLARRVALKLIAPWSIRDERILGRLQREAQAIAKLRHPNIVNVFATGEEEGIRYIAMELVPGRGLDERLREANESRKRIPIPQILRWIADIAGALHAAHEHGLIHRDVKPSNIRITPEGRAVLLDFGLAHNPSSSTMTKTGEFQGSPYYCSPEQVAAKRIGIDHRTDVYSLGVTLYEAVTGKLPFEGDTTEQVFNQILVKEPVHPRKLDPSIAADLENVILLAISKERGDRYQTAEAFQEDINNLLEIRPIRARPVGNWTRLKRWSQRNPALAWSLATVVVVLLASSVVTGELFRRTRAALEVAENEGTRAKQEQRRAEVAADKSARVRRFFQETLFYPLSHQGGHEVKAVDLIKIAADRVSVEFREDLDLQGELLFTFGLCLMDLGQFSKAREFLMASLSLREKTLGKEHEETLATKMFLAEAYCYLGDYRTWNCLHHETFEGQARTLGYSHPDTLDSLLGIGKSWQFQGEYRRADPFLAAAYDWSILAFGLDHYQTLRALVFYAGNLNRLGDTEKPIPLLRNAIYSAQRVFTDKGRDYLYILCELGIAHFVRKEFSEAKTYLQESFRGLVDKQGAGGTNLLATKSYLGKTLCELGEVDEGLDLLRESLTTARTQLGELNFETLSLGQTLLFYLDRSRFVDERISIGRDLVRTVERLRGLAHKEAHRARHELSLDLEFAGLLGEAVELNERSLVLIASAKGDLSPSRAELLMSLARCLMKQGKSLESLPHIQEALAWRKSNLPSRHWQTGSSMTLLGLALGDLKRFDEADPLLTEGFTMLEASLETPKNVRESVLQGMAQFYKEWGKEIRQKECLEQLEKLKQK